MHIVQQCRQKVQ